MFIPIIVVATVAAGVWYFMYKKSDSNCCGGSHSEAENDSDNTSGTSGS